MVNSMVASVVAATDWLEAGLHPTQTAKLDIITRGKPKRMKSELRICNNCRIIHPTSGFGVCRLAFRRSIRLRRMWRRPFDKAEFGNAQTIHFFDRYIIIAKGNRVAELGDKIKDFRDIAA